MQSCGRKWERGKDREKVEGGRKEGRKWGREEIQGDEGSQACLRGEQWFLSTPMQPVRCGWLLIRSQLKGVVQGRGQKLHLNFYAEKLAWMQEKALPHLSVRWAHLVHVLWALTKAQSHCTFCPHAQKHQAQMIGGILNHVSVQWASPIHFTAERKQR